MHALQYVSFFNYFCSTHVVMILGMGMYAYSKPICEWTTRRAQRMESVTGFSDPAANGARVRGMRPAETILFGDVSHITEIAAMSWSMALHIHGLYSPQTEIAHTSQSSSDSFRGWAMARVQALGRLQFRRWSEAAAAESDCAG